MAIPLGPRRLPLVIALRVVVLTVRNDQTGRIVTRNSYILAAAGGSLALLAGAYLFQALGYAPCRMCLWQRWPHFAAIAIGVIALVVKGPVMPSLGALATAVTSGLGIYHTGVERAWWLGPASCTSAGGLDGLAGGDLLSMDGPALVLCDQVSWALIGISMASWNALFSAVLVILWVMAIRASLRSA